MKRTRRTSRAPSDRRGSASPAAVATRRLDRRRGLGPAASGSTAVRPTGRTTFPSRLTRIPFRVDRRRTVRTTRRRSRPSSTPPPRPSCPLLPCGRHCRRHCCCQRPGQRLHRRQPTCVAESHLEGEGRVATARTKGVRAARPREARAGGLGALPGAVRSWLPPRVGWAGAGAGAVRWEPA